MATKLRSRKEWMNLKPMADSGVFVEPDYSNGVVVGNVTGIKFKDNRFQSVVTFSAIHTAFFE